MTVADIRLRLEAIEFMIGDDESAHVAEDQLHEDVLKYYARGGKNPDLAIEALKSKDIEFARHCA